MFTTDGYRVRVDWYGYRFWVERSDKTFTLLDLAISVGEDADNGFSESDFNSFAVRWDITIVGFVAVDSVSPTTIYKNGAWQISKYDP